MLNLIKQICPPTGQQTQQHLQQSSGSKCNSHLSSFVANVTFLAGTDTEGGSAPCCLCVFVFQCLSAFFCIDSLWQPHLMNSATQRTNSGTHSIVGSPVSCISMLLHPYLLCISLYSPIWGYLFTHERQHAAAVSWFCVSHGPQSDFDYPLTFPLAWLLLFNISMLPLSLYCISIAELFESNLFQSWQTQQIAPSCSTNYFGCHLAHKPYTNLYNTFIDAFVTSI